MSSATAAPEALVGDLALMAITGPVEELGWRGIALPLLQRRLAPRWAGLALGVVWGLWHLPAFLLASTPQGTWSFGPFLAGAVAASVIATALFNASRGSILLAALLHFQLINPLWPDAQPYDMFRFILGGGVVVLINRRAMLCTGEAVIEVIPDQAGRTRDGGSCVRNRRARFRPRDRKGVPSSEGYLLRVSRCACLDPADRGRIACC